MNFFSHSALEPIFIIPQEISTSTCQPPFAALPLEMPLLSRPSKGELLIPKPYRILQNITAISTCIHRNAAIDYNHILWTWGANSMAQTETGEYTNDMPQQVDYIPKKQMEQVLMVSQGAWHTLCITKDQKLWGWGLNEFGELGIGNQTQSVEPVYIMDHCIFVYANDSQSFAIKSDGSLWGWGLNENGVILHTDEICKIPIHLLDSVTTVCVGTKFAFAVREDHTLWGWGQNVSGTIFTKPRYQRCTPTLLMNGVRDISIPASYGDDYCLVLMDNGDLYSLGDHDPGALVSWKQRKSAGQQPIKVMEHVAEVKAGHHFSLIRLLDGRVVSIGANETGQCGIGKSTGNVRSPNVILSHSVGISAGHFHGMGLQENGDLWIWGADYSFPKSSITKK